MALRSDAFLRGLSQAGTINLYAIAGRASDCGGEFIQEAFAGEVVYTGTQITVSLSDLDRFMADGPAAVPSFTVYPISLARFRRIWTWRGIERSRSA